MKFDFWCIAVLVSIHTRQVLAKEHDEVMKEEQGFEHTHRDEVERDLQARIIDGDRVPIDAYPWFALPFLDVSETDEIQVDDEILDDDGLHRGGCGASLVAPDMVLTAAHCVNDLYALAALHGGFTIGQYCLENVSNNCGQYSEFHYMDAIFPHPNYGVNNNGLFIYDYAIIKLKEKTMIEPVPLDQNAFALDYEEGKTLWAVGFGLTDTDSTNPDMRAPSYLLHAEVNYVDPKTCTDTYTEGKPVNGDTFEDEPSIMCAGNPGKGICQGDSGGPLFDEENKVLVGVTSFSSSQCSEFPSGFANVASEWPWIQETICKNHGANNAPDFCETFTPKECDKGETLVSIQIETKVLNDDCWWGLYNHEKDEIIAEEGGFFRGSTYQYDYCLEENVCTIMYLAGRNSESDSIFEVTMKNGTMKGDFAPEMERIIFFPSAVCSLDIQDPFLYPFSSAWKVNTGLSLPLILGFLISAMMTI